MTLDDLTKSLADVPPETPVVFASPEGETTGEYHITEFRLLNIDGIDCGGRKDGWQEARLELMDGYNGHPMTASKLASIFQRSTSGLSGLGDAPLSIEFGHENKGMSIYSPGRPMRGSAQVTIPMTPVGAVCKPMALSRAPRKPAQAKTDCCA